MTEKFQKKKKLILFLYRCKFLKNVYTEAGIIIPPVMTIELISGSIIEHE